MRISFERAGPADAEALVQVQVRAFHDDARLYPGIPPSGPPGYDSLPVMLEKIQRDEVYKVLREGQIIGDLIICPQGDGHYHLDVICIDPDHHNQGIGTQAMQFMEQQYPDASRWTLDTPFYAIRNQHFYEKLGYVKVAENPVPVEEIEDFRLFAYEKRR